MIKLSPRVRLPHLLTHYFPGALWRVDTLQKEVFLTFDDGPVPEITPWVLGLLRQHQIKACFFCVGENVQKNPSIYKQILQEGHQVGNHTFNHVQGLKVSNMAYFRNTLKAAKYIQSPFFRPPHGWMRRQQYQTIENHFQVVMWDILSGDYRQELAADEVVSNVLDFVRPGSVITFHDSEKAWKNLRVALPEVIEQLKKQGYHFGLLPNRQAEIRLAI